MQERCAILFCQPEALFRITEQIEAVGMAGILGLKILERPFHIVRRTKVILRENGVNAVFVKLTDFPFRPFAHIVLTEAA